MLYVPWVAEVSLAEILLLQFFKSLLASFSVSAFVQSKLQGSGKLLNERRSNICYTSEPQYIQMLLLYDRYTCLTTFSKQKLSQFIFLLLLVSSLESIFSVFLCLSETEFFFFSSLCTSGWISGSQLLADFFMISSSLCNRGGKNAHLYIYIVTDLDFCLTHKVINEYTHEQNKLWGIGAENSMGLHLDAFKGCLHWKQER